MMPAVAASLAVGIVTVAMTLRLVSVVVWTVNGIILAVNYLLVWVARVVFMYIRKW